MCVWINLLSYGTVWAGIGGGDGGASGWGQPVEPLCASWAGVIAAQSGLGSMAVFAMLLAVVVWLLFRSHRYWRRLQSQRPSSAEDLAEGHGNGCALEVPAEVARWQVEMHDLARQLSGQLDSKMGALQHLIREADRAAARLEAALAATGSAGQLAEDTARRPRTQAESLTAGSHSPPRWAADTPVPPPHTPAHRRQEIYLLADYGNDAAEIARRVAMPVGEVELILGLRPQS